MKQEVRIDQRQEVKRPVLWELTLSIRSHDGSQCGGSGVFVSLAFCGVPGALSV